MKTPNWVVITAHANPDYTIDIKFADGSQKRYDAHRLLEKPVYADLVNLGLFLSAKAECGTIVWSDDLDIAPEHLYEYSEPVFEAQS